MLPWEQQRQSKSERGRLTGADSQMVQVLTGDGRVRVDEESKAAGFLFHWGKKGFWKMGKSHFCFGDYQITIITASWLCVSLHITKLQFTSMSVHDSKLVSTILL